jgi:putative two-component system response regulator
VALGERLGLPEEDRIALRRGGVIHDIGKVAVPERVLLKPGPLDVHERQLMEAHPAIGERICAPLKSFRNVLPIIRWHHERQDGSGYPDRLRGHQIPLVARVLQTADVFDALTTDRPYRKALSSDRAFGILRDEVRRGWWDGKLVDEFERLLKESPEALARQAPVIQPHKTEEKARGSASAASSEAAQREARTLITMLR